eukprot:gene8551-17639_t
MLVFVLFLSSTRSAFVSRSNITRFLDRWLVKIRATSSKSNDIVSYSALIANKQMLKVKFDNRNFRSLPIDPLTENTCRQVPNAIFSKVQPEPLENPALVSCSPTALELIGIDSESVDNKQLVSFLSGNTILSGSEPYSHCYCGHQFGSFAGQLGDGAAISLGEVITSNGARWEVQLKGAGKTPYSRHADGRKVLRSTVREYLCSEAMNYLNIPSTRAAACITSDSTVQRDPLYDGRVIDERCTVVSRIAPNFFRIGSFEIFKSSPPGSGERSGPSAGNVALLRQLTDHIIQNYFNHLLTSKTRTSGTMTDTKTGKETAIDTDIDIDVYAAFLREVVDSTARLASKWQTVGFVHGVLNTDNLSIMGITIDYGPFGFMEYFDSDFVPNGSDGSGRYSYANQPAACRWALQRLAEALAPLLSSPDSTSGSMALQSEEVGRRFDALYASEYIAIMRRKLGLLTAQPGDLELMNDLFRTMETCSTDFTDTFRALTGFVSRGRDGSYADIEPLMDLLVKRSATPTELVSSLRRKVRISRPSLPPQRTMQLWELLQQGPEQSVSISIQGPLPTPDVNVDVNVDVDDNV